MLYSNFHYHEKAIDLNKPLIAFIQMTHTSAGVNSPKNIAVTGYEDDLIETPPALFIIRISMDKDYNVKCLSPEFEYALNNPGYNDEIKKDFLLYNGVDDFLTQSIQASIKGIPFVIGNYLISYQIENEDILETLDKRGHSHYFIDKDKNFNEGFIARLKADSDKIYTSVQLQVLLKENDAETISTLKSPIESNLAINSENKSPISVTSLLAKNLIDKLLPLIEQKFKKEEKSEEEQDDVDLKVIAQEYLARKKEQQPSSNYEKEQLDYKTACKEVIVDVYQSSAYLKEALLYVSQIYFQQTLDLTPEQKRNSDRIKHMLF